jgi:hypothetical protein
VAEQGTKNYFYRPNLGVHSIQWFQR